VGSISSGEPKTKLLNQYEHWKLGAAEVELWVLGFLSPSAETIRSAGLSVAGLKELYCTV
jgi:hypothetical protein